MADDHTIFVGGKPFMNYVTAVVMQFTTKGANRVVISSRGKFISRAVDVAEVVRSRFLRDQIGVQDITMDSEEFKNKEGRTVRVSTLDIAMHRIAKEAAPVVAVEETPVEAPVVETPVEPVSEESEAPATPEPEVVEQLDETPEAEETEEVEETEASE